MSEFKYKKYKYKKMFSTTASIIKIRPSLSIVY